jgi:hypothetical protein
MVRSQRWAGEAAVTGGAPQSSSANAANQTVPRTRRDGSFDDRSLISPPSRAGATRDDYRPGGVSVARPTMAAFRFPLSAVGRQLSENCARQQPADVMPAQAGIQGGSAGTYGFPPARA